MVKKYYHRFKKFMRHHYHKALRQEIDPHAIALGFAIGTCIGILPTGGFGILVALFIMLFFKSLNKIAVFAGLAIWNPLTMIPVYYLSYGIGNWILGVGDNEVINTSITNVRTQMLKSAFEFSEKYLVGNIILAVTISLASYFFMRKAVIVYQHRKAKRMLRKQRRI